MSNARNLANLLSAATGAGIDSADIIDGAITDGDIANASITNAKLATPANLGSGFFQGDNASGGGNGNTTDGKKDIFRVHEQELNTNVTIAATDNAVAAGPLTVASGVTLTVANGGRLAIV